MSNQSNTSPLSEFYDTVQKTGFLNLRFSTNVKVISLKLRNKERGFYSGDRKVEFFFSNRCHRNDRKAA